LNRLVFDPCIVITIGVFENYNLHRGDKAGSAKDSRIGKIINVRNLEDCNIEPTPKPIDVLFLNFKDQKNKTVRIEQLDTTRVHRTDPKDHRICELGHLFKKTVSDSNAIVQDKALDAVNCALLNIR
ncbi:hypothetical protein Tco_1430365, partial [Tanacetum coccineum]